jgi:hypothetical protein
MTSTAPFTSTSAAAIFGLVSRTRRYLSSLGFWLMLRVSVEMSVRVASLSTTFSSSPSGVFSAAYLRRAPHHG